MATDDPHGVAALIHTALYDTGGELMEGAFVDHWESYAYRAREQLRAIFAEHGFSGADRARLAAVLVAPDAPEDATVELVTALLPHTESLVVEMLTAPLASARAIALRAGARIFSPTLLVAALNDPHPHVRAVALRTVASQWRTIPAAEDYLLDALTDESPLVRAVAATMRFYNYPRGAAALVRCFAKESDPAVKKAIITNIAETTRRAGITASPDQVAAGLGEGIKALLLAQLAHEDAEIRVLVVRALDRLHGVEIATAMLDRLLIEPEASVRHVLVMYMGYAVIASRALPIFTEMLARDPDTTVRVRVAWLLRPFGAPAVPALIRALDDPTGPRRPAAITLGYIGDVRALPALTRELANPDNSRFRHEIARAIDDVLLTLRPGPSMPNLAAVIQHHIDALHPTPLGAWPMRVCKEELNALPLHSTMIYLWAIQPDGTVLCMDHEAFAHPTAPETDPLKRFAALVNGARTYRELEELVPLPPAGTKICVDCDACGFYLDAQGDTVSCLRCNGVGWLIGGR